MFCCSSYWISQRFQVLLFLKFVIFEVKHFLIFFSEMSEKALQFNSTFVTKLRQLLTVDMTSTARLTLENQKVQSLLTSDRYDLIIIDLAMCEALVVLGHYFSAPVILVSTVGTMEMVNMVTWNSQPFAYVPSLFLPYSDEMTFLQRVTNTVVSTVLNVLATTIIFPSHAALVKQQFPNAPSFQKMLYNISLTLVNAHYSIVETPRPYQPNVIPIGGFHVQTQDITEELKRYLDNATEGAVLFSLGTNLKSSILPAEKLNVICESFAKFPQKFLWKFENDFLNVPKNVKIMKWVPQRAVLGMMHKDHYIFNY